MIAVSAVCAQSKDIEKTLILRAIFQYFNRCAILD